MDNNVNWQNFYLDWYVFVAVLLIYICVKLIYLLRRKNTEIQNIQEIDENFKTPDQIAEVKENKEESIENDELLNLQQTVKLIPLEFKKLTPEKSFKRSEEFYNLMNKRRTVRHFSNESVPTEIIYNIIKAVGTLSGDNYTQLWTYVLVNSLDVKKKVKEIIEDEEEINYVQRMGKTWTNDLKKLKTNWVKNYLTEASHLIFLFKNMYSYETNGKKVIHHHNEENVALVTGVLLTAIHYAGLVTVTSTPMNCGPALRTLLNRPKSERLVLLLPIGYPAANCMIPDLKRKPLNEILVEF